MGHKNVGDAQQLTGGQHPNLSDIEQQRAPLEHKLDVNDRIAEWSVDELAVHNGAHQITRVQQNGAEPGGPAPFLRVIDGRWSEVHIAHAATAWWHRRRLLLRLLRHHRLGRDQ
jgi:hypothetical protein